MQIKNNKGFVQLLFNPLVLLILLLLLILMFSPINPFKLAIINTFTWNGFTFQEHKTDLSTTRQGCSGAGGDGNVEFTENKPLVLRIKGNNNAVTKKVTTEITGIDEILIIYEGYAECNGADGYGGFTGVIYGSEGGDIGAGSGVGCGRSNPSLNQIFRPAIWKFRNNFDGTWSYLESLNVGDIFIDKKREIIKGNKQYLDLMVYAGSGCGVPAQGSASLTVYSIVRKESGFALCKADKYSYDLNGDGKIAQDGSECVDLRTVVLNSEEAIKESFDEKIKRITAELEAKNKGLTVEIDLLKQRLAQEEAKPIPTTDTTAIEQRLAQLESELKDTKAVLADVQAKDKNVVNTIEQQEQFKRPNFIKEFFNKIIMWIKNLFS